jgi:hypothetical protein
MVFFFLNDNKVNVAATSFEWKGLLKYADGVRFTTNRNVSRPKLWLQVNP